MKSLPPDLTSHLDRRSLVGTHVDVALAAAARARLGVDVLYGVPPKDRQPRPRDRLVLLVGTGNVVTEVLQ